MDCQQFMFSVLPWFVALIVLNAVETILLIGVTVRQLSIRSTVLDAIEARLLELDQDQERLARPWERQQGIVTSRSHQSETPQAS